MQQLPHPFFDIGPELLGVALDQFDTMLHQLRARTDLSEAQARRLDLFGVLSGRFRLAQPLLVEWRQQIGAVKADETPHHKLIYLLMPTDEGAEGSAALLTELGDALQELLERTPTTPEQARTRAAGLAIMSNAYTIFHQTFFNLSTWGFSSIRNASPATAQNAPA